MIFSTVPSFRTRVMITSLLSRYASVGILNTLIHWVVFSALFVSGITQSFANFAAFCIAVTFSFFVNARWTFNAKATTRRYLLYIAFMGSIAFLTGRLADVFTIAPAVTVVAFSSLSLLCGFIYSCLFVFRGPK